VFKLPAVALTFAIILLGLAPARAQPCKSVSGTTTAELTSEACTSPAGLCTTGALDSRFGALEGTFSLTVDVLEVCGEDLLCYQGTLTLEARAGTVVLHDVGTLDLGTGAFGDVAVSESGTRLFAQVTTTLVFAGQIEGTTLHGTLSGTLCR
jgi:hypothetical protein